MKRKQKWQKQRSKKNKLIVTAITDTTLEVVDNAWVVVQDDQRTRHIEVSYGRDTIVRAIENRKGFGPCTLDEHVFTDGTLWGDHQLQIMRIKLAFVRRAIYGTTSFDQLNP